MKVECLRLQWSRILRDFEQQRNFLITSITARISRLNYRYEVT
jgi:hypothetical protein